VVELGGLVEFGNEDGCLNSHAGLVQEYASSREARLEVKAVGQVKAATIFGRTIIGALEF